MFKWLIVIVVFLCGCNKQEVLVSPVVENVPNYKYVHCFYVQLNVSLKTPEAAVSFLPVSAQEVEIHWKWKPKNIIEIWIWTNKDLEQTRKILLSSLNVIKVKTHEEIYDNF